MHFLYEYTRSYYRQLLLDGEGTTKIQHRRRYVVADTDRPMKYARQQSRDRDKDDSRTNAMNHHKYYLCTHFIFTAPKVAKDLLSSTAALHT